MQVVICPGIHSPVFTEQFIQALPEQLSQALIVPADQPVYSGMHILAFLLQQMNGLAQLHRNCFNPIQFSQTQFSQIRATVQTPILLIGFSAGVVGAITVAYLWQSLGGQVVALVAIDGWGVPLSANFPIHRLSHDHFTHWSSALLGAGQTSFYADPAVAHLDLWHSPQTAQGWAIESAYSIRTTAAQFLDQLLQHYQAEI